MTRSRDAGGDTPDRSRPRDARSECWQHPRRDRLLGGRSRRSRQEAAGSMASRSSSMPPMVMQRIRSAQVVDPGSDPTESCRRSSWDCITSRCTPTRQRRWRDSPAVRRQGRAIRKQGVLYQLRRRVAVRHTGANGEPSAGHSIDHIGFRPANVDNSVAALKAMSVKVTTEPRPLVLPSGTAMRLAFIEGPGGVRIELVQRDNLK